MVKAALYTPCTAPNKFFSSIPGLALNSILYTAVRVIAAPGHRRLRWKKFSRRGGAASSGEIAVSGSKNATLAILASALIASEGQVVLTNVPQISDVRVMSAMLTGLGVDARFVAKNTLLGRRLRTCIPRRLPTS